MRCWITVSKNTVGIIADKSGSLCETRGWCSLPINRVQLATVCMQCLGWLEEINTTSKKHMGQAGTKLVPISAQNENHKSKIWDMCPSRGTCHKYL